MQIQKNTQLYSIFLDISGSVGNSSNYWDTVNDIFIQYAKDIQNYYFWHSHVQHVDKKQFEKAIKLKRGTGGTQPQNVASECVNKNIKNIILITDGQVSDYNVQQCDRLLANHKFNKSICYIISTSSYASVNMSVTCAFTRNCQNKVFKKEKDKQIQTIVQFKPDDYKVLDTLDQITLENFTAQYNKIQGLIIALNMGKQGNIPLKNDLVKMKNRLVRQLAKQKAKDKKDISDVIRDHLQKNNFTSAIQQISNLSKAYFIDTITCELESKINHLISLCGDLRGKYDLNQIKSNKMATAQQATAAKIDQEVQMTDLSKNLIECPIINDDDVPQILIDQCEPLLVGIDKNIVDDITTCPLRLLNYPDLKAKLKSRLSNFVGVMGIKAQFNKDLLKNPFTQNRLLGGIPLGTHHSHVKVGNYTIAKMISGGKILGNMNLYYALIWYLIKEGSIEYLKDIEKNATEHLIYRLKNSKTYASMCGKSQFVSTFVSTDIALWFCVNSGYLNHETNKDTFRFHFYDIEYMKKIVETLGYPIHKGFDAHYNRTKTLFGFLSRAKNFSNQSQRKSFKNSLVGLYQNGIIVDSKNVNKYFTKNEICTTFIPVDGPASEQQIKKIRDLFTKGFKYTENLSNEDLYYLGNLIDSKKFPSDYFLDYNLQTPQLPKAQINWNYGLQKPQILVKISSNTLKPEKQQQAFFKKDNFNGYKKFDSFVFKYHKMPTYDELVLFFYNRYIVAGKTHTLPYLTEQWTKDIISNYQPIFDSMKIQEIKNKFNQLRNKQNNLIQLEKKIENKKQN